MSKLESISIYVTATQKIQSNTAYFGIVAKEKGKKKVEKVSGVFYAESRVETQLKAMIHALSFVKAANQVHLYSDSKFVDSFLDGTVGTWELADWCKGNGKTIEAAAYWMELNRLVEQLNVTFHKTTSKKEMEEPLKLLTAAKKLPEVYMTLNLGNLVEVAKESPSTLEDNAHIVEEAMMNAVVQEESAEVVTEEESVMEKSVEEKKMKSTKTVKRPREKSSTPVSEPETLLENDKKDSLTLAIDQQTLAECEELFSNLGLDTETAVKLFLKQSLRTKSIPFELKMK